MEDVTTLSVSLESRDLLVQKIVDALTSEDVNSVGVYGMGGSGKTTLGKEVANKAKGIFKTTVMVDISETPNIKRIQDQIADGLGLPLHDVHGIPQKAIRLYTQLKSEDNSEGEKDDENHDKKTLIVLDNIWHKINLDEVGIPIDNCKLLLTSEEKNVCKAMDVQEANIFEVGLLNEKAAKFLFQFQVQKHVQSGEYELLADRLLEKCGGLPLTIVATANSVKGKELPLWRQFAEELEKPISCQVSGARSETFSILRTSYEVMEREEKQIFFLLAYLSPIGSSISIDNLMRYGIGLDLFQHVNKLSDAIEQARTWAEELVSSSMLLEGDSKENVKIHDVIRKFTMSFASQTDLNKGRHMFLVDAIPRLICNETFNKYTGISLLPHTNYSCLNGVKADLLQILLLEGNGNHNSSLKSDFFQGMTNLKVLAMSNMGFEKGLPESMGKLKDLKTLHLEICKLGDIKLIGKLESLLVLSLSGSFLEGLPDEIGKLYNLRLLDMSRCQCEEPRIPANVIARLSLLEGLYLVDSSFKKWGVTQTESTDAGTRDGASMDELNKLDYLNVLEMSVLGSIPSTISAQFVKNLDKFKINVGPDYIVGKPSQRVFTVTGFDAGRELKNNNWLKALLKKADLLSLQSSKFKNIVPELEKEGFRDLSCLNLSYLRGIRRICDGKAPTGLFFNLRHLRLWYLKEMEYVLPVNPLPLNLTTLEFSDCDSLTFIFSENGVGVNEESHFIELPCLKSLRLSFVYSLLSVVKLSSDDDSRDQGFFNSKVKFPSLEQLSLYMNRRIVKIWGEESNIHSFQNLKDLEIYMCDALQSLGPPSMFSALVQLESLTISLCDNIQEVISKESREQEIPEEIITFSKLKRIRMRHLPDLKCFYGGGYELKFPHVEKLELFNLKSMDKFAGFENSTAFFHEKIEFPCLEELVVSKLSDKVMALWRFHAEEEGEGITSNPVPKIRKLTIGKIKLPLIVTQSLSCLTFESIGDVKIVLSSSENEGTIWTHTQFPKLEELTVWGVPNSIEQLFEDDENEASSAMLNFCGQLRRLTLSYPSNMKFISLHPFISLRFLYISGLKWEYVFSIDGGLEQLQSLEELDISCCRNLEVIIRGGDKDDGVVFPRLKSLKLEYLESMRKFSSISDAPLQFPSLETLQVKCCRKLEELWSGPFIAPKLRKLEVVECDGLQWFLCGKPNYVVELPSLGNVDISSCAAMESFSSIPLKAAKLRELVVSDCPKMEWFFLGNTNCGADLELPSLEHVDINRCPNMQSFSPALLRASKLARVTVDSHNCPMLEIEDLNQFLQTRCGST